MSVQGNEYQPIFAYLKSLNFHFLDTWVIECVNYYKSTNPNISLETLKNEVKQQWLLVNLREIKVPSLPPDLKSKDKVILNGQYAVQVESMIDSSVSCYSLFQKMVKFNTENIDATKDKEAPKDKATRCLTFVICDGVQEIEAMEYQPIKKIRSNDAELLPGFKMVILGPVECRKGMILLKDENVRICGGEVDTLTVTNNLKNMLMRKLDLDESDFTVLTSPFLVEEEKENTENQSHQTANASNLEDGCVENLLSQNDDVFLSLPLETEILAEGGQSNKSLSENQINRTLSESQTNKSLSENQINKTLNESQTNKSLQEMEPLNDLFEEDITIWSDDELYTDNNKPNSRKHSLPQEDLETSKQKRQSLELKHNEAGSSFIRNSSQLNEDRDIFIDDFDEPEVTLPTPKTKKSVQTKLSSFFKNNDSTKPCSISTATQKPIVPSNKPFVYLKHIKSTNLTQTTVFTVKAIILTLKKKITIKNDEFNLKVTITDGSCSVDVDFCSAVLEDLLGYSPCEMAAMLKAKQTNSAISQRIKESFSKAQEKLISLNCLMKIRFSPDGRSPVVLSLEEVTMQHVKALKDRKLV